MKSAEEWAVKAGYSHTDDIQPEWLEISGGQFVRWAKKIQFDAYKSGMTKAAAIAEQAGDSVGNGSGELSCIEAATAGGCYEGGKAILAARDKVTEI